MLDGRKITGVEITRSGSISALSARDVIVSAGSTRSPAILQRVGIVPAGHLHQLGIPLMTDRPGAGANLHDHPMISRSSLLSPGARLPLRQRRHIFLGLRWSPGIADCLPADMCAVAHNRGVWHPVGWRIGGILVWINKSCSRGWVKVSIRSPETEPEVMFDLLGDVRDLRRMMEGVR